MKEHADIYGLGEIICGIKPGTVDGPFPWEDDPLDDDDIEHPKDTI
jgi:hypothetical protein